jgi:hypothetical protein
MPLYPSIVLRTKERAPTPCSFVVFHLGFTFESFKELGVLRTKELELYLYLLTSYQLLLR